MTMTWRELSSRPNRRLSDVPEGVAGEQPAERGSEQPLPHLGRTRADGVNPRAAAAAAAAAEPPHLEPEQALAVLVLAPQLGPDR